MKTVVRYLAYPGVLGGSAVLMIALASKGLAYWPIFPMVLLAGLLAVAVLERWVPYEKAWNENHGDLVTDIGHNLANHALIQVTVISLFMVRAHWSPEPALWPASWPMWAQVLMAGVVLDISLYTMHRWSHVQTFLWKLHAIHHSPERLYWLNSERRHPLSAMLLAGPGLAALVLLGATPSAVSCWFAILTLHLAFQHSNLDYRVGPFKWLLGVAEVHRWHHKREYEDAQVNFGEFWMLWDHLGGTFHLGDRPLRVGELGLKDAGFPQHYLGQFVWPFKRSAGL